MPAPRNDIVRELLEIAARAIEAEGRGTFEQVALRRAVSDVYYAVFHALCALCAEELGGHDRGALVEPIYRSVEHASARRRLGSAEGRGLGEEVERVGALFALLQEQRSAADYGPPHVLVSRREARALLAQAREAVQLLGSLDPSVRKRLAILLIAKPR